MLVPGDMLELSDNYEHADQKIEYLVENEIFYPSHITKSFEDLREAFNSHLSSSCNCSEECSTEFCSHGGCYKEFSYPESSKAELILNEFRKNREFIYECSQFCKCPETCRNRLVQFGPRLDLEVRDCGTEKRQGLFTKAVIPVGGFICEYAGELLTKSEAVRRDAMKDPMKYLLCLNEISSDGVKSQTFVDPIRKGNIGRYLNHSCDPNCEIICVRIDNILPKLGIFATRQIAPEEELTFDYAEGCSQASTGDKTCLCMSEKCRKFLPNTCF
ncbi:probable histone-lysine N-methyltransferase set-23 [Phlebotomus argentipes]|uniref:probable histone-lysine N-methyltransferase set-23 n=1 Tax=Phlebotomus argentipes TaxID=94469 RepID=UPI002892FD48|nr:probable histone-lysine N-methyltransferase set-23 [Phlebotomus argentipes]